MKLKFLAILCSLALLAGCGAADLDTTLYSGDIPSPPPVASDPAVAHFFALGPDAPEPLWDAALVFCDKLWEKSSGRVVAEIVTSRSPLRDLSLGNVHFAFLSGQEAAVLSSYVSAMRTPFNYRSYMHFTMAANNEEIISILADDFSGRHRFFPLAGFYAGSSHFLSNSDDINFSRIEGESGIVLIPGSNATAGFSSLGYEPFAEASYETRFSLLASGEAFIIEVTSMELVTHGNWIDTRYSYIPTMHDVNMQFLFVGSDFWESLDDVSRAAAIQARSYMFPLIDDSYLRYETMMQSLIDNYIVHVAAMPRAFPSNIRRGWQSNQEPDNMANHLIRLIAGIAV